MNRLQYKLNAIPFALYIVMQSCILMEAGKYEYVFNFRDSLYFSTFAFIIFYIFVRLSKEMRDCSFADFIITHMALAYSFTFFINELLNLFQIVHVGNVKIIIAEIVISFIFAIMLNLWKRKYSK